MGLSGAVASILGRKEHEGYREVGQNMKVQPLYKLLGLKGSPMLYHYMSGHTDTIEPERALVIYQKFDILIDLWLDIEELERDATNTEVSLQIAREPIREIIEEVVEVEQSTELETMRRGLRKLIAKYY